MSSRILEGRQKAPCQRWDLGHFYLIWGSLPNKWNLTRQRYQDHNPFLPEQVTPVYDSEKKKNIFIVWQSLGFFFFIFWD